MRHGQTNWNINKILQGQTNIDLNETGINQAKAKIGEIKNLDINLIFCSPLNRAAQTAKIVSNGKIPIIYNDSLTERCFGDFEGKKSLEYSNEYYNYNANLKTNNVEPIQDLCNRVYSFLDEISRTYKDKKILLVTHGATARAINSYFNGLSKDGYVEKISIDNCTLKEFEYSIWFFNQYNKTINFWKNWILIGLIPLLFKAFLINYIKPLDF